MWSGTAKGQLEQIIRKFFAIGSADDSIDQAQSTVADELAHLVATVDGDAEEIQRVFEHRSR